MLTADGDARGVRGALAAGAAGYVNKMCGLSNLLDALTAVAAGETVVALAASRVPGQQQPGGALDARRLASYLTARERECLGMLTEGAQTATMAKSLGVSPATVRTHVQAVLTKLGVHSRLEAASLALRHDLIAAPQRCVK
ncbi:response regulator transcription factor [Saccharopolyspora sp. 6T]|uniref:response regulator transcription factor n=1 Tax=Saccharopolyspora sp. 6T TaxID=2877238 RepID=UPI001CD1C643|nr:response regulator transcription factor [Saccharopolyspora sp. 6T]MCA1185674.1 response regulator transcription factor [Saccharopolyspora sp. 6T]